MIVSPAPHVHNNDSVMKNMYNVVIALLPAYFTSIYFFGLGSIIVSCTAILACVLFEFLIQKFILKGKITINNGSAILTGMLLSFNIPANLEWWIVIIGAFVAIAIGKMTFGGLGNNIFNPALVGRAFLLISFPAQMTTWPIPQGFATKYLDAETGATILTKLKESANIDFDKVNLLIGNMGGSLGEVSAIALIIGFIYLISTRTITWHIPVTIVATVALFAGIFHLIDPSTYASPIVHLLSGGMMLGAIFMATDYVTSPMSIKGQVIFAIGIGLITMVIRFWGAYPEGMSFAILIMNAATPLINNYCKPKRFGEKVKTLKK